MANSSYLFLLILENVHHFKLKGQSRINCRIKTKLTYILFNPPQKKYIYGSNVKNIQTL